ncbi:MAG: PCRF domain-containing protein, partial [Candidatus Wildermuthbacteria bacterium]|nr:PCRF domain-containing protein [Candidatus Wildermuthbacteria bacterium]
MIDFKSIKQEYDSLTQQLTNPELISQWEKFQEISKKRGSLEKILKKLDELEELKNKIEENAQIVASQEDEELSSLAQQELVALQQQKKNLEREIEKLGSRRDADLPDALIAEIRPGTGGEEAALFARNLFDMYAAYAKKHDWKQTILDLESTDLGGIKSASLQIDGEDAFEKLQYEGGVHRVQRIPETEKSGRVHTSTASVAVLPKPKSNQISLNPSDIKIEFARSSGAGGQNVN